MRSLFILLALSTAALADGPMTKRQSLYYDRCLASGRTEIACKAVLRLLAERDEREQAAYWQSVIECSDRYYEKHPIDEDNVFVKLAGGPLIPKECL